MASSLTMKELKAAIVSLKLRKSPGKEGITNDMLKRLGKSMLLKLMNTIYMWGIVPHVWKEAKMIPILKKDKDRLDSNSHRPTSLLICFTKSCMEMPGVLS
jgi:hypothetical protein